MKKIFCVLSLCCLFAAPGIAQNTTPAFGKIEVADLELKECDFEKDANAMVLFDKGDVYYDTDFGIIMERQKRVKIFNDKGKDEANVRIEFYSGGHYETIYGIQAQTINLVDGKPEIIKLEKKLIYTEMVDKSRSAIVFSFPNVKSGSVIEYKYTWKTASYGNMPDWTFQDEIPVKYSELTTAIPDIFFFRQQPKLRQSYAKNTSKPDVKTWDGDAINIDVRTVALANVVSLQDEPYMSSRRDNLQSLTFQLVRLSPVGQFVRTGQDSWAKVGGILAEHEDFGLQLKKKLAGEELIIAKAKAMKTQEQKIDYLFKEVRNNMKWNGSDEWYTNDGTPKAWETKTGNSTEVNLILYHLLKQSGVTAYPMIVSTRKHGKVNQVYPFLYQFNKTVTYIPVDTAHFYVLDATNKYHGYREIPDDLLNSAGLYLDKENKQFDMITLRNLAPARKSIFVQAQITPDGKLDGKVNIANYSYHRAESLNDFKSLTEEKYKDQLKNFDPSIKITSLKFENADIDTLPATQTLDFKQDLNSDGDYIYFKPNIFAPFHVNPFLSENRTTDLDFSHRNYYNVGGTYTLPAGYATEALPKNLTLTMPDGSITFRRVVGQADGAITLRYTIDFKKVLYFKESYAELRDFYKQLIEMMGEQIILKKS